ncbi:HalOD1 output domain-containing protein [Haladaptatus sp. NG-SE-30]
MDAPDEHDGSDNARLSLRVVNAIAEHEQTNPTEVRPILYDIIDPDALDTLFEDTNTGHPRAQGHVSFEYGPHEVVVYSNGEVEVVDAGASESSSTATESASNDN